MKRTFLLLSTAAVLLTGCESSKIVQSGTAPRNRITMELVGTGEELLERRKIDAHRVSKASDGVAIDAWAITHRTGEASRGTVVVLHGEDQSKANYIGVGTNLAQMGYDVVLVDLRMHGRSGGNYITCGAKEKQDVRQVLKAFVKDGVVAPKPIYVFGVTFGGATAIQFAAIEPAVAGVVAIAPWKDTVSKARRDMGQLASQDELETQLDEAGRIADFDPYKTSAVLAAAKVQCPVYLIHGMLDLVVPIADSRDLYNALPGPKKLKIISPGPEQMAVGIGWESWVPEQIDLVATGKLDFDTAQSTTEEQPATDADHSDGSGETAEPTGS
jgi:uncharacterized protein